MNQLCTEARRAIYTSELKDDRLKCDLLKELDNEETGILNALKLLLILVKNTEAHHD